MKIGDLNKRIILQYKTKVPDGMGGSNDTWVTAATIWAALWPISAADITAANSTTMVISHRIRIRYRSVLKSSWRIKYGNRYFAIVSIINVGEKNQILDIMAKEAV